MTKASAHILLTYAASIVAFILAMHHVPVHADEMSTLQGKMRGMDGGGFGRIVLSLPELPKSEIKISNSILVWKFDRPIEMRTDHLESELPAYISAVRLDPDRRALRLALQQNLIFNLQDAATDLYLDLLPKGWKGPYPPLPDDIVRDLSRRAREAEAALKNLDHRPATDLTFDLANNPAMTLIRIHPVKESDIVSKVDGGRLDLVFNGAFHVVNPQWVKSLPAGMNVQSLSEAPDRVHIILSSDFAGQIKTYFDDNAFVIEWPKKKSAAATPEPDMLATGSIGEIVELISPAVAAVKAAIEIRASLDHDDPVVSLNLPSDVPQALFMADGKAFLVFQSSHALDLPEAARGRQGALSGITLASSSDVKTVIFKLGERHFPILEHDGAGMKIRFASKPDPQFASLTVLSRMDGQDTRHALINLGDAANILTIDDPETGFRYLVAPSLIANSGFQDQHVYPEFIVAPSVQGVAVRPLADDLDLHADAGALVISRANGPLALTVPDDTDEKLAGSAVPIIRAEHYRSLPVNVVQSEIGRNIDAINQSEPQLRALPRLKLSRLYAAHGLYHEAAAMMELVMADRGPGKATPRDEIERAFYLSLSGRHQDQLAFYARPDIDVYPEAALFLAYDLASLARFSDAISAYKRSGTTLAQYPATFVRQILPVLAEAAIESHDIPTASNLVASFDAYADESGKDIYHYLVARLDELTGKTDDAVSLYRALAGSHDPAVWVKAKQALYNSPPEMQRLTSADRLVEFEALSLLWHGDVIEARSLAGVAENAFSSGAWRSGFAALRRLNQSYPDMPGVRPLLDRATAELESFFDGPRADKISSVDAISLFMEYREFAPVGRRGDELIRKLADRLVGLDLLPQAAELMRYQLTYRLEGPAKASAAPKLAYIFLLDRKPKEALQVLSETRMGGLEDGLMRSRLLLEARAHADLGDVEGALESVSHLDGDDVEHLRAEILWQARDWQRAAEFSERLIGNHRDEGSNWQDDASLYVMRAAIGYALTGDALALDRLRGRYSARMAERPEGAAFRFLTTPLSNHAPLASEYASSYPGGSAIDGFMLYYREHYLNPSAKRTNQTQDGKAG